MRQYANLMKGKYIGPTVLRFNEKVTQDSGVRALETSLDFISLYEKCNSVVNKRSKNEIHKDFYPLYEQNVIEVMDVINDAQPLQGLRPKYASSPPTFPCLKQFVLATSCIEGGLTGAGPSLLINFFLAWLRGCCRG